MVESHAYAHPPAALGQRPGLDVAIVGGGALDHPGQSVSATTQLLLLHADAPPTPPDRNHVQPGSMSWANGAAGVLGFLTRFRDLTPGDTAIAPF